MHPDERLERLEQRVASLERLVRELSARSGVGAGSPPSAAVQAAPTPVAGVASGSPRARRETTPRQPSPAPRRLIDPEEWIGQRGLLAVGVVAMIVAAGYLLKLSFDRGWISPAVRCAGGALAGGVVAMVGWRLHRRYGTYGAALMGCGAAIVYLAVWSASRLYGLVPPIPGILLLALVSLALAAAAWKIDVEALGATAALGAFFAPILLGREASEADLLLVYLACMAAGLGWVAAARSWRMAAGVVAASYFGLGGLAAEDATAAGVVAFGAAGGAAALMTGLRHGWWEVRFLAFSGGWGMVWAGSASDAAPLVVLAGALAMAAPVWAHALRLPPRWPLDVPAGAQRAVSAGEALYFVATPLLLAWPVRQMAPDLFGAYPGLLPLVMAVPYLAAGYARVRPPFAAVGISGLAVAIFAHWSGPAAAVALLALAVLVAVLDRPFRRADGAIYSVAILGLVLAHLTEDARLARPATEPAFVGAWPLALWASAGVASLLAARLWHLGRKPPTERLVRGGLWIAAGVIVFLGVTSELRRAFGIEFGAASLAGELAVSAWWIASSAALVMLGFARSIKPVRIAGLVVAGLAVAKVTLHDLASLDALYRVASVFILGLASLSLAYLYHRQARRDLPPAETAAPSANHAPDPAAS